MFSIPLMIALAMYGVSAAIYMVFLGGLWKGGQPWARAVLAVAAAAHLLAIGWHHASGLSPGILSPPSLLSLGLFVLVASYLVVNLFRRTPMVGATLAPLATIVLGTLVNSAGARPPHLEFVPFVTPVHIVTSAMGFACFGVAFVASMLLLIADRRLRERRGIGWPRLPAISTLDRVARVAVNVGFPFYTLGIALGAVWAYWGGEGAADISPEYVMGVMSWLLFAVHVFICRTTGWQGRKAAVLTMLGFLATLAVVMMYVARRF